jgi:hypothetical protein
VHNARRLCYCAVLRIMWPRSSSAPHQVAAASQRRDTGRPGVACGVPWARLHAECRGLGSLPQYGSCGPVGLLQQWVAGRGGCSTRGKRAHGARHSYVSVLFGRALAFLGRAVVAWLLHRPGCYTGLAVTQACAACLKGRWCWLRWEQLGFGAPARWTAATSLFSSAADLRQVSWQLLVLVSWQLLRAPSLRRQSCYRRGRPAPTPM